MSNVHDLNSGFVDHVQASCAYIADGTRLKLYAGDSFTDQCEMCKHHGAYFGQNAIAEINGL